MTLFFRFKFFLSSCKYRTVFLKKILLFVSFFQFLLLTVSGQGIVKGLIFDKKTKEPLIGAAIVVEGTTMGTTANLDGEFSLKIPQGKYTLVVSYVSYQTKKYPNIAISSGKETVLNIELEEANVALQDVVVVGQKRTDTELSMLSAVKSNLQVVSGISSQQIAKTVDRDASEVIKRVPGITVMGDRFVVVRGLNQRYNNVWLNGSSVPSSEADQRAFSFDIIPSSYIDNLLIYKTASPEYPGDFSGGFVAINMKNMPTKNELSVSYGTSYNSGTTFEPFISYNGGSLDWLGFDDGTRQLPSGLPTHLKTITSNTQLADIGKMFNNDWSISTNKVLPTQRFSVSSSSISNKGNVKVGNITALNYSNSYDITTSQTNNFDAYDRDRDASIYKYRLTDQRYSNTVKLSLLHNWSFLTKTGTKLEFCNLFSQIASNRTVLREGQEMYIESDIKQMEYKYQNRLNYITQLKGEHKFDKDESAKIDWVGGYAFSDKSDPDLRRFKTNRTIGTDNPFQTTITPQGESGYISRSYFKLNEHIGTLTGNYTKEFKKSVLEQIKTGIFAEYKYRNFSPRIFSVKQSIGFNTQLLSLSAENLFVDDNFNSTWGILPIEITEKSDAYTAWNALAAGYIAAKLKLAPRLTLYGGARLEYNSMHLNSYYKASNTPAVVDNNKVDILPSANLSYNINQKNILRLAYGRTVNRPEFRELAPFYFMDFDLNGGVFGNPELQNAYIHNVDLRYELYPSPTETVTLAVFYKQFINPIEFVLISNDNGDYSYRNAPEASSKGLELDIRKDLSFIGLKNFSVVANASYLLSEVKYADGSLYESRPLTGQSPYIINGGIFYANDKWGLNANVQYNRVGERIVALGMTFADANDNVPNIVEEARNVLDLSISKEFGKNFSIKFDIKDMLSEDVVFSQHKTFTKNGEKVRREQIKEKYNPGSTYTITLKYLFNN